MQFKVGDRIVYIGGGSYDESSPFITMGKPYTVIYDEYHISGCVKVINNKGNGWFVKLRFFQLEEAPLNLPEWF